MKSLFEVISAPLITEKGTLVNEGANQVIFRVPRDANTAEIRGAVESFFKVRVTKVRTMNYMGKTRRVGRTVGRRPAWKKAYVTLAAGQRVDFFESA